MKTEVEQLLYYSVPGFFIESLFLFYLLLIGKTEFISTTVAAVLVVIAIPIGYIVYQAYTSMGFYTRVWKKWYSGGDANFQFIGKMIDERVVDLSPELRKDVRESISSPYLFNFLAFSSQDVETIEYSWRLVNLINGRAVAIFSCLLAALIPIGHIVYYFMTQYFPLFPEVYVRFDQSLNIWGPYYIVLAIIVFVMHRRISHIKQRLVCYNQGILIPNLEKLDELIWAYVAFNTVSKVENLLTMKEDVPVSAWRLLKEAHEELKAKHWKKAFEKAKEVHQAISGK